MNYEVSMRHSFSSTPLIYSTSNKRAPGPYNYITCKVAVLSRGTMGGAVGKVLLLAMVQLQAIGKANTLTGVFHSFTSLLPWHWVTPCRG